jgi:hypothetical protein
MDFLVQLRWSHGDNALLQPGSMVGKTLPIAPSASNTAVSTPVTAPTIVVTGDGTAIPTPQNTSVSGADYVVPNPSSTVSVSITFLPTIAGIQAEVLSANQTYSVSGTSLVESTATIGPTASPSTVTKHPLITTTAQSTSSSGQAVVTVQVNTDFVDATTHWKSILGKMTTCAGQAMNPWAAYDKLHEPGTELVVLGFTAGPPVLWYVIVPDVSKSASQVSTLVFFRPTAYRFTKLDDATHKWGWWAAMRYLVRPRSTDPGIWWAWDRYHHVSPSGDPHQDYLNAVAAPGQVNEYYDWLCAGFENSLNKSGKSLLLVLPQRSTDDGFGAAAGQNLMRHLASIRALLAARGKIGVGQPSVTAAALGLAAYSAGSTGLYPCLQLNQANVNEVYMFDLNDDTANAGLLGNWAAQAPSGWALKIAAGERNPGTAAGIKNTVLQQAPGGTAATYPASASFYQPSGGDPWWTYVFSLDPGILTNPANSSWISGTRHQFVIYGGEDSSFTAGSPGVTFLQKFLTESTNFKVP